MNALYILPLKAPPAFLAQALTNLWQHLTQEAMICRPEADCAGMVGAAAAQQGIHLGGGKAGEQDGLAVQARPATAQVGGGSSSIRMYYV